MDYILYHANCNDGNTCAAIAKERWPGIKQIPVSYGDEVPLEIFGKYGDEVPLEIFGKSVLIADFSWPRGVIERIRKGTAELVVLDHHETAEAELAGLDYCKFDMSKCGAEMTWEYCFPGRPMPHGVRLVGDRDLWKWEFGDKTRQMYAGLSIVDLNQWYHAVCVNWAKTIQDGVAIAEYQRRHVERAAEKCGRTGSWVWLNCTTLISETGHRMLELNPLVGVACLWFEDSTGAIKVSLRSRSVDVSAIAKKYGGGGHHSAAGLTMPNYAELMKLIEKES